MGVCMCSCVCNRELHYQDFNTGPSVQNIQHLMPRPQRGSKRRLRTCRWQERPQGAQPGTSGCGNSWHGSSQSVRTPLHSSKLFYQALSPARCSSQRGLDSIDRTFVTTHFLQSYHKRIRASPIHTSSSSSNFLLLGSQQQQEKMTKLVILTCKMPIIVTVLVENLC